MTEMIKFEPLLKQTLWGGSKIAAFKHLDTNLENIGESWEISGVDGSVSVVAEGPLKGRSLSELMMQQKGLLVGQSNYERFGNEFPLLVKFIDATHDLSIQVHPDDEVARRHGYHHGKTEMWYCLGGSATTPPDGDMTGTVPPMLYCGLKKAITPQQYEQMVANHTITGALARYEVHDGDAFFIPAGRVHSIGAGCFVAEIQQTSDVTYRIYDFNRRDKDGNLRQLHTKEASESIDYTVLDDYRTNYGRGKNERRQIVACQQFTVAVYDLDRPMLLDYSELDSFVILMGLEGSATLDTGDEQTSLNAGETVLVAATAREITVRGQARFIEAYV